MTIEEIRAKAPEGATHVVPNFMGEEVFVKIINDSAYIWNDYDSMPNRWRKLHYVNKSNVHIYKSHAKPLH